MYIIVVCFHLVLFLINYEVSPSIPPAICFAPFRWQDCGRPPTPVMYYWKPGSRCEVGLWRGCLPNLNMFKDEYECVSTCIFSARAGDEDYHKLNQVLKVIDFHMSLATEKHTTINRYVNKVRVGVQPAGLACVKMYQMCAGPKPPVAAATKLQETGSSSKMEEYTNYNIYTVLV
ncbi:hypothetical protein NE865_08073 [Phthorimaea operculella]|nr:hypothetical protein NE865_08073 [Phthorimaea operculella]